MYNVPPYIPLILLRTANLKLMQGAIIRACLNADVPKESSHFAG